MKRIFDLRFLVAISGIIILASCIQGLVTSTLYQYDRANKSATVPETPPTPYQKIDLKDAQGHRTVGWYYEYTNKNAPVILYFHGNASNLEEVNDAGFLDDVKKLNVNFAIFDYPKYGLSTGDLSEKAVVQSSQAVYEYVKQKFPKSQFIIWGRSMGCAIATIIAEKNQSGVAKLILTSPWNSFWKLIKVKTNLSDDASKKAAIGNEYETEVHAKNIFMPVLIHHGTVDQVVPWEMGKELSQDFGGNDVTFVSLEGLDHNNLQVPQYWDDISQFIKY
jgi:alpha-beta hydrolase superfamily lysophospholipase